MVISLDKNSCDDLIGAGSLHDQRQEKEDEKKKNKTAVMKVVVLRKGTVERNTWILDSTALQ